MIAARLKAARLVPVVVIEDAKDAIPLARALRDGGLPVAEVTFRTAAAREAISIIAREFPDFLVGAGTVTQLAELEAAKAAGAVFAVAPGTNARIISRAREIALPFIPGIATGTEIEAALDLGCTTLKFFPASQAGGPAMLNTLSTVYGHRGIQFMPTGGINENNFKEYLGAKNVIAIGGSWMVASALIKAKEWGKIAELTKAAVNSLLA